MSSTKSTAESPIRKQPRSLDPATTPATEIFSEFVDENDDVCSRCFRQKYDVLETSDERIADRERVVHDGDQEVVELEQLIRRRRVTFRECVPPNEGQSFADLETTICRCGDVDQSSIASRSRELALDHAANLSATLSRWELPLDWLELLDRVGRGKRTPSLANDDWLLFDLAVTAAVRKGRGVDVEPALEIVRENH